MVNEARKMLTGSKVAIWEKESLSGVCGVRIEPVFAEYTQSAHIKVDRGYLIQPCVLLALMWALNQAIRTMDP